MERRDGPNDRRRRKIHHIAEIPDRGQHPLKYRMLQVRWKLAVWTVVYPVQIALVVALAVCAIPVYLLLDAQADLRNSQAELRGAVQTIQTNRIAVTKDICAQLDRNARTSNAQLDLFKGIIVGSVKQSRPFEKTYRTLGLPRYKLRLKSAKKTAKKIDMLKLPLPNCRAAIFKVATSVPPRNLPPSKYGGPH